MTLPRGILRTPEYTGSEKSRFFFFIFFERFASRSECKTWASAPERTSGRSKARQFFPCRFAIVAVVARFRLCGHLATLQTCFDLAQRRLYPAGVAGVGNECYLKIKLTVKRLAVF